jgi:photosystem II stability/assembly factor-like uncharacterized protein
MLEYSNIQRDAEHSKKFLAEKSAVTTKQSILLFTLDITEKGIGWSHQKRPHAPPDIAKYLVVSVVKRIDTIT